MDIAVAAAKKAFHRYSEWRVLDASQRGRLLLKLADLLERDAQYLSELETLDCGKPQKNSKTEVYYSASVLRYYAGKADKILGSTVPAGKNITHIMPIHLIVQKQYIFISNNLFRWGSFDLNIEGACGCMCPNHSVELSHRNDLLEDRTCSGCW